jgi:[acyl-carrier-protein] S-malonyltransferase
MRKRAFIFPGQGSQSVGMTAECPNAAAWWTKANAVLGMDLQSLVTNGPEEVLRHTENAQPAILTASLIAYDLLGETPDVVAGHSLGEYTAMVVAGVLSFETAVALVRRRGQLMEKAVPNGQGTMAAILGMEASALDTLCQADAGEVQLANLNCPGQIVISGETEAVKRVCSAATTGGAKRAILLDVSGPFHSSLMRPAAEAFAAELDRVDFYDAKIPVIANVTAEAVQDAKTIRRLLVEQLYSPVRWQESIERLVGMGVTEFKEVGPGNVLTGLLKKIIKAPVVA